MEEQGKILGCILGGAIGDAFGSAYEGRPLPVAVSDESQWQLSDDTQLTLATCEAIAQSAGRVEPAAIAARFAAWHRGARVTGIGASTFKALTELVVGGHWALVGMKGERAAGNGAAMRAAPLAFCLDPKDQQARRTIRDVSRITHHHEEAYAGALAVVVAVRAAWQGDWNGERSLLELVIDLLPDTQVRDRLVTLSQLGEELSFQEIGRRFGCSGFVIESVPLALYGAARIGSLGFASLIRELIAAGGDTDTIASMAGQVAGALLGRPSLPEEMLLRLPDRPWIETIAGQFAEAVAREALDE
jgi:ADP-ribosylglycohydrolase